jgi:hypothetical protein
MTFRILVEDEQFDNHNPLVIKDNINQIIENIELVYKKNLDPNYHEIVYRIKNQIKLAGLSPNSNLNIYMEFDELTNENIIEYLTNLMEVAVDSMTSDYQVVHIESAIKSMVDLFDVYEQINPELEIDRKSFKQLLESAQSNRRVSSEDLSNNQALQKYYKEVLYNMDELIGETPYYTYQNIKKFVIENINSKPIIDSKTKEVNIIEGWNPFSKLIDPDSSFKEKAISFATIGAGAFGINWIWSYFNKITNKVSLYTLSDVPAKVATEVDKMKNGQPFNEQLLMSFVSENSGKASYYKVFEEMYEYVRSSTGLTTQINNSIRKALNESENALLTINSLTTGNMLTGGLLVGAAAIVVWAYNSIIRPALVDVANNHIVLNNKFNKLVKVYKIDQLSETSKLRAEYERCVSNKGIDGLIDIAKCDVGFINGIYYILTLKLLADIKSKGLNISNLKTQTDLYAFDSFETKLIKSYDERIACLKSIQELLTDYNPNTIDEIDKSYKSAYLEINKSNVEGDFKNRNQFQFQSNQTINKPTTNFNFNNNRKK